MVVDNLGSLEGESLGNSVPDNYLPTKSCDEQTSSPDMLRNADIMGKEPSLSLGLNITENNGLESPLSEKSRSILADICRDNKEGMVGGDPSGRSSEGCLDGNIDKDRIARAVETSEPEVERLHADFSRPLDVCKEIVLYITPVDKLDESRVRDLQQGRGAMRNRDLKEKKDEVGSIERNMKIGNRHAPKVLFPEYLYDMTPDIAKSLDRDRGFAGNNDSTYDFVNVAHHNFSTNTWCSLSVAAQRKYRDLFSTKKLTIYEDMVNRPNADAMLKSEAANLILERAMDKELMQKYIELLDAQLPTDLRDDFCFINVDGCQMIKEHDRIKAHRDNLQIDNEYSGLEYMLSKLVTEELWKMFGSCKVVLWRLHHLTSNEYTLLVIRKRDKRFIRYTSFKNGNHQNLTRQMADYVINWMDEIYVGSAFEALATQNPKDWRELITGHDELGRVNIEYARMSTAEKTTRNYIISKKLKS
ncbi:hypothetical protein OROMI_023211 [Orobanche minor]